MGLYHTQEFCLRLHEALALQLLPWKSSSKLFCMRPYKDIFAEGIHSKSA